MIASKHKNGWLAALLLGLISLTSHSMEAPPEPIEQIDRRSIGEFREATNNQIALEYGICTKCKDRKFLANTFLRQLDSLLAEDLSAGKDARKTIKTGIQIILKNLGENSKTFVHIRDNPHDTLDIFLQTQRYCLKLKRALDIFNRRKILDIHSLGIHSPYFLLTELHTNFDSQLMQLYPELSKYQQTAAVTFRETSDGKFFVDYFFPLLQDVVANKGSKLAHAEFMRYWIDGFTIIIRDMNRLSNSSIFGKPSSNSLANQGSLLITTRNKNYLVETKRLLRVVEEWIFPKTLPLDRESITEAIANFDITLERFQNPDMAPATSTSATISDTPSVEEPPHSSSPDSPRIIMSKKKTSPYSSPRLQRKLSLSRFSHANTSKVDDDSDTDTESNPKEYKRSLSLSSIAKSLTLSRESSRQKEAADMAPPVAPSGDEVHPRRKNSLKISPKIRKKASTDQRNEELKDTDQVSQKKLKSKKSSKGRTSTPRAKASTEDEIHPSFL